MWYGNNTDVPTDSFCQICSENILHNNNKIAIITITTLVITMLFILVVVLFIVKRFKERVAFKTIATCIINDITHMPQNRENGKFTEFVYKGQDVIAHMITENKFDIENEHTATCVYHLKHLNHENVNQFIGICTESLNTCSLR